MILLVGGVARCGKTSLAQRLTEQDAIAHLSTDALVGVLQNIAPQVGINFDNQGRQPELAESALDSLLRFFEYTQQCYLLEGVVVTPEFAARAVADGVAIKAVFLGDESMDEARLRISPGWVAELPDAKLASLAAHLRAESRRMRQRCEQAGQTYVDTGADRESALLAARALLVGPGVQQVH